MFRSNQPVHPRMDIGVTGPCCPLPLTRKVDPPWDPLPLLATVRMGMGHLELEGQDGTELGCWDGAAGWVGLGDTAMGAQRKRTRVFKVRCMGLWFAQQRLARGLCPIQCQGGTPDPRSVHCSRAVGVCPCSWPLVVSGPAAFPPCSPLPHPRRGFPWMGVGCSLPAVGSELSSSPPAGAFSRTTEFCSRSDWPCLPVTLRLGLSAMSWGSLTLYDPEPSRGGNGYTEAEPIPRPTLSHLPVPQLSLSKARRPCWVPTHPYVLFPLSGTRGQGCGGVSIPVQPTARSDDVWDPLLPALPGEAQTGNSRGTGFPSDSRVGQGRAFGGWGTAVAPMCARELMSVDVPRYKA